MPDTNLGWGQYVEPDVDATEQPQPVPQPAPQPSFTQQAAGAPRWTSADDMRYARRAASLNQVRDDLDSGVLHPQHAAPLLAKLSGDLSEMDQQKMAFDQRQQESATQQALGQNAMQRAVEQQNQNHSADGFLGNMRTFIDPISGKDAHFFQAEPGKWEQVNMRHGAEAAGGEEAPTSEGSPGGQTDATGEGGQAPEPFTQTIYNGPNRTDTTWQPGQTQGVSSGSWMGQPGGQPPPPDAGGGSFGLSPQKMQEINNLALLHSSHLPPGVQRNTLYSHIAQRLTAAAIQEQGANRRANTAATVKQQAESDKEWRDLRTAAHKSIDDDHKAATKAGEPSPYGTPAQRLKAADDLANEQWAARHPESQRAKDWIGGQTGEKPKVEPAAPPPKTLMQQITLSPRMSAHEAESRVNKEMDKITKDGAEANDVPDPENPGTLHGGMSWKEMPTRFQRAEAERRVAKDLGITPKPPATAQQQPAQPPAPKVEPLPKEKYTDAEIRAEIERRKAARLQSGRAQPEPFLGM